MSCLKMPQKHGEESYSSSSSAIDIKNNRINKCRSLKEEWKRGGGGGGGTETVAEHK